LCNLFKRSQKSVFVIEIVSDIKKEFEDDLWTETMR